MPFPPAGEIRRSAPRLALRLRLRRWLSLVPRSSGETVSDTTASDTSSSGTPVGERRELASVA